MTNHKSLLMMSTLLVLLSSTTVGTPRAVAADSAVPSRGWYAGLEGGLPFGVSTFSSFGYDKTRPGWAAGLYGGYRFNPVLSAELVAKYGGMKLAVQDCCSTQEYWLGADGVRYNAAVLGMEGFNYRDVQSKVSIGQYGARLNVNVLGFFKRTRQSRWAVDLSPHLYAVSTKASLQTMDGGKDFLSYDAKWHLGYGGDVRGAYFITPHLQVGVYTGLTALTGSKMDAMPKYRHENNFVWESGLRLGFLFGKDDNTASSGNASATTTPEPERTVCPEETEAPAEAAPRDQVSVEPIKEPAASSAGENAEGDKVEAVTFPDIYFGFNRIGVSASETTKLQSIFDTLQSNPDMKVCVKGWCDTRGPASVNKIYSRQRAEAVKAWLVKRGISADRIEAIGMGSDFEAQDAAKARRASTEQQPESDR